MYYLLSYNIADEKKDMWFAGPIYNKKQEKVDDMFLFSTGNPINPSDILTPLTIILDEKESGTKGRTVKDKVSTSTVGAGILFIISPATKAVFDKLKLNSLQYFDVIIKGKNVELIDYKIVNVASKIDCADIEASDIDMKSEDQIRTITSLVLNEKKIPKGTQIFLLGRKKTAIIIVHEDFKKAIEETGLTGFQFVQLEDAGQLY